MTIRFLVAFLLEPLSYLTFSLSIFFLFRMEKGRKLMVLAAYYLICSIIFFRRIQNQDEANIFSYNVLLPPLTLVSLAFYFHETLYQLSKKWTVVLLGALYIVYYVVNNFFSAKPAIFDSMEYVLLAICILAMVFMYMHQLLTDVAEEHLENNSDFWIVSSQLVYYLGSLITFLTYNYLARKILPDEKYSGDGGRILAWLWDVHNVLLFLSSVITVGSVTWISFRRKQLW